MCVVNVAALMQAIREIPMQPIHFMFLTAVPRKMVKLNEANNKLASVTIDAKSLKNAFKRAKQMLKSGNLSNIKALVERYVNSVTIYKNEIIIEFNIFGEFTVREAFSG